MTIFWREKFRRRLEFFKRLENMFQTTTKAIILHSSHTKHLFVFDNAKKLLFAIVYRAFPFFSKTVEIKIKIIQTDIKNGKSEMC